MHKADFMGRAPEPGWRGFLQQGKAAEIPGREVEGSEWAWKSSRWRE